MRIKKRVYVRLYIQMIVQWAPSYQGHMIKLFTYGSGITTPMRWSVHRLVEDMQAVLIVWRLVTTKNRYIKLYILYWESWFWDLLPRISFTATEYMDLIFNLKTSADFLPSTLVFCALGVKIMFRLDFSETIGQLLTIGQIYFVCIMFLV